jgi:hypothetical protein
MGRDHVVKSNGWSKRLKPGFIQTVSILTAETVEVQDSSCGFLEDVGQGSVDVCYSIYFVKLKPHLINCEDRYKLKQISSHIDIQVRTGF